MIRNQQPAKANSVPPQGRVATQDGRIWPLARAAMTERLPILDRMADDMLELQSASGCATADELIERGWTRRQVDTFNIAAAERAKRIEAGLDAADPLSA